MQPTHSTPHCRRHTSHSSTTWLLMLRPGPPGPGHPAAQALVRARPESSRHSNQLEFTPTLFVRAPFAPRCFVSGSRAVRTLQSVRLKPLRAPLAVVVLEGLCSCPERSRASLVIRPPARLDTEQVAALRAQGVSWREIAVRLEVGVGTVHRLAQAGSRGQSLTAPLSG